MTIRDRTRSTRSASQPCYLSPQRGKLQKLEWIIPTSASDTPQLGDATDWPSVGETSLTQTIGHHIGHARTGLLRDRVTVRGACMKDEDLQKMLMSLQS